MKTFLKKFKEWIYVWLWIIVTLSIWVFATYQFQEYQNIDDVEVWQTLTKDIFNQLLGNVRNLNSETNILSWSINTLNWVLQDDVEDLDSRINVLNWNINTLSWVLQDLKTGTIWAWLLSPTSANWVTTRWVYRWTYVEPLSWLSSTLNIDTDWTKIYKIWINSSNAWFQYEYAGQVLEIPNLPKIISGGVANSNPVYLYENETGYTGLAFIATQKWNFIKNWKNYCIDIVWYSEGINNKFIVYTIISELSINWNWSYTEPINFVKYN
jgi:hypothetical protein